MSLFNLIRKVFRRHVGVQSEVELSTGQKNQRREDLDTSTVDERVPLKSQSNWRKQPQPPVRSQIRTRESGNRKGSDTWVPPGQSATVKGRLLVDGMVYVGEELRGASPYVTVDPSLINPKLRVNNRFPDDAGDKMSYWPSYSTIEPSSRAAYLNWLAEGRPGDAYIGYVFLFFYGIERRILSDIDPSDAINSETDLLVGEVERLLDLYGDNNSFKSYASEFLSVVKCLRINLNRCDLVPPSSGRRWELPLELKVGLGSFLASATPVPPAWALSWLRLHPEISLRTPASRCPAEFDALVKARYRQAYGAGMRISPNKTPLRHSYRPSSATFTESIDLSFGTLPDVSRLKKPVNLLRKLGESVCAELDQYSRWVGRHGDRETLGAVALLPTDLVRESKSKELSNFLKRIDLALGDKDVATISVDELIAGFPSKRDCSFTTKEAGVFGQFLERLGFGVAPDIRYSKINLTKHHQAVLFRLSGEEALPSDRYQAATVLLQLGAAVAVADGKVTSDEERLMETHLERTLDLPAADKMRLRALLQWLLINPPTLGRMKSRINALTASERDLVARYVILIAAADGSISPDEIKVLIRLYTLLGIDTEQLHRDIHELSSAPATGPVTVVRPDEATGYRIPAPTPSPQPITGRIELNRERIEEVMKSTSEVSDLLAVIFDGPTEDEPIDSESEDIISEDGGATEQGPVFGGLDAEHSHLVMILSKAPRWPRKEFNRVAGDLGLMPAGAIEIINETAFDCCGEPLVEGSEMLEVNEDALKELLNAK